MSKRARDQPAALKRFTPARDERRYFANLGVDDEEHEDDYKDKPARRQKPLDWAHEREQQESLGAVLRAEVARNEVTPAVMGLSPALLVDAVQGLFEAFLWNARTKLLEGLKVRVCCLLVVG